VADGSAERLPTRAFNREVAWLDVHSTGASERHLAIRASFRQLLHSARIHQSRFALICCSIRFRVRRKKYVLKGARPNGPSPAGRARMTAQPFERAINEKKFSP
jgi:hypothetical protein